MCKKTNYKIPNPRIDKCMVQFITTLDCMGDKIKPVSCCCGHGKYPMTVIVRNQSGTCWELISGKMIYRKRNFYKRDKQGYYYIPETIQSNERICKCGHKEWEEHKSTLDPMVAQECNVKGCKCKKFLQKR